MRRGETGNRRGIVALMLLVCSVATASAVAHVWTHLEVIDYGYRISRASGQRDGLRERNRRLRIELAVLKDPARVARLATERMGFGPPEPEQIRRLRRPKACASGTDDWPLGWRRWAIRPVTRGRQDRGETHRTAQQGSGVVLAAGSAPDKAGLRRAKGASQHSAGH